MDKPMIKFQGRSFLKQKEPKIPCSKLMQCMFGELAHYGSEPFNYSYVSIGLTNDFVPLVKVTVNVMPHYHNMDMDRR